MLLVLIQLSGVLTVGLIALNLAGDSPPWAFLAAASIVGPLIAVYVGLTRYTPHLTTSKALRLSVPRGRELGLIGLGVAAGVALAPLIGELTAWVLRVWPLGGDVSEPDDLVFFGVAQLVVSPIAQEALFRGLILGRLRLTVGPSKAVIWTTALYVASVLQPRVMPEAAAIAVVVAFLALWSETLWPCIAAHVASQVTQLFLADRQPLPLLLAGGVVLAFALLTAWRTGRRRA